MMEEVEMNPTPSPPWTDRLRAFSPRVGWWLSGAVMLLHLVVAYIAKDGSWVSAGGAMVIVLGVLTIARGLIRQGDEKVMRAGRSIMRLVKEVDGKLVSAEPEADRQRYEDARAEFQHGPGIVIVGTLINGYGAMLAARFLCEKCFLG